MGQRVEKLHRCRGLVGYATTTNALLPEPQVIREKVATQMWASVSIDYSETVAALLSSSAKEKFSFRPKLFGGENCQKDG